MQLLACSILQNKKFFFSEASPDRNQYVNIKGNELTELQQILSGIDSMSDTPTKEGIRINAYHLFVLYKDPTAGAPALQSQYITERVPLDVVTLVRGNLDK